MEDQPGSRQRLVRRLFDQPGVYLRNSAHIEIRRRATRELVEPLLSALPRPEIVDVGCGDARCSLQFLAPSSHLTLVDLAPAMLSIAASRIPPGLEANTTLVENTLEAFSPPSAFDLVICLGVLAHVPDVRAAVRKLAELTRPGGAVLVQLTDHEEVLSLVNDAFHRFKRLVMSDPGYTIQRPRVADVVAWAEDAGLRLSATRQYWVLPPLAGRLPEETGLDLLHRLYESPRASRFGTEKLLLLTRPKEAQR